MNPEDEIFIACSPRIVRRRLGSLSDNNGNSTNGNQQPNPDQLTLPSPGESITIKIGDDAIEPINMEIADITPNGSLRRRRSRIPSEEDETGLMDFLRSSGSSGDGLRERRGAEQYGSLDRSWSRKTRRRPNLMDFVNDERERPVSPAPPHPDHKVTGNEQSDSRISPTELKGETERKIKGESPVRYSLFPLKIRDTETLKVAKFDCPFEENGVNGLLLGSSTLRMVEVVKFPSGGHPATISASIWIRDTWGERFTRASHPARRRGRS